MKRPWQIWSLFSLCLAMVMAVMVWLTHMALEFERAEILSQQQAELEETVGSVLWQMDAELTRLLAPEIARPSLFYQSFFPAVGGKGEARQMPSPLLRSPSPYVLLHFELRPDDSWHSPQCPSDDWYELALANGATAEAIRQTQERLQRLAQGVHYAQLLEKVPEQTLETDLVAQTQWASNTAFMRGENGPNPFQNEFLDYDAQQGQPTPGQIEQVPENQWQGQGQQIARSVNPNAFDRNLRVQSRRQQDLQNRGAALQAAAQQAFFDQRFNFELVAPRRPETEGVSQPVWVDSRLLLVRRVVSGGQTRIQGCWLDWDKIRQELLDQAASLLPEAELVPVTDKSQVRFTRVLATMPAQLVVPEPAATIAPLSPIRISLLVAWSFCALAAAAMFALLKGVVALSERRAAFVSAVTHELRTPLTTFRMYAEMLSEGMVQGPDRQRTYLQTLRVEADRLSHLVENVLQYARLERTARGRGREEIQLGILLDRIEPRLADRATQAEMTLEIEAGEAARDLVVRTDPAAVEQILFNLVDNACKYASGAEDRRVHLEIESSGGRIQLRVRDHGPGVAPSDAKRLFRPFSKSARRAADSAPGVGLGLALCRRLATALGGRLDVRCDEAGAAFVLTLPR